jgi:hypothetical protein
MPKTVILLNPISVKVFCIAGTGLLPAPIPKIFKLFKAVADETVLLIMNVGMEKF